MTVLINFKICDNSEDCSGIEACPTKAFYWDAKKKTIAVDESKCTNCGLCADACPVDAIMVAKTREECEEMKKEIEEDPREVSDLFVDRYGAQPIHPGFVIPQDKFEVQILRSTKLAVAELFKNETIMCLLHSIPVKQLFQGDIKYRKVEVKDDELLKKYRVERLPALLFFQDGKLLGKVEGYFEQKNREDLRKKIAKFIKREGN